MEQEQTEKLISAADASYARGLLDDALIAYREALELNPDLAWAWSRIGAILAQDGQLEDAEDHLLKAIELDPELPQAHSNLGNIFYARGEYEAALEKYKEAVRLSPSTAVFHENLHAAYKKLGKLGEAVAALKQAHRVEREQTKTEAKAKMEQVKQSAKGRFGCFSTVLLLASIAATAMLLF